MKFFDIRSSVEIPNMPAELFARKLLGALNHYNINADICIPNRKITFTTSPFQFHYSWELRWKRRLLIFYGVSLGEIEFFNQGKDLIVKFNLSFVPTRIIFPAIALLMILVSMIDHFYPLLIMAGFMIILYFVAVDTARHNFKKWFSRFRK